MAFHRAIVVASHNDILLELFDSMAPRLRTAMIDMLKIKGAFGEDADHDAHTHVVEAIAARDEHLGCAGWQRWECAAHCVTRAARLRLLGAQRPLWGERMERSGCW